MLAEAWRGGPQHHLCRLLRGCRLEPLGEAQARAVGVLIAHSDVHDTVDAAVVEGALRRDDAVVTSNRTHVEQLAAAANRRLAIQDV
ncbi:MAG: hypothetical protein AB7W59_24555 [Acidimicrobiia bacterium]